MTKNHLIFVIKFGVSSAVLYLLLFLTPFDQILHQIKKVGAGFFILAVLLTLFHIFVITLRWQKILAVLAVPKLPQGLFWHTMIGFGFSQGLPSTVGGDIYRVFAMAKYWDNLTNCVLSVVFDRVSGLIGLGILSSLAVFYSPAFFFGKNVIWMISIIIITLSGSLIVFKFLTTARLGKLMSFLLRLLTQLMSADFAKNFRSQCLMFLELKVDRKQIFSIFLLAILSQILLCSAFFVFLQGLGATASVLCVLLIPIVMLVTLIPITIGGWGLREAASVVILGGVGVQPDVAIAVGILFGLSQVLVGLLGLCVFPFKR